jgi:hypothetical protein
MYGRKDLQADDRILEGRHDERRSRADEEDR